MSLEEAILDKVRRLPPAKQEEVLRFADGLQDSARARIVPSRDSNRGNEVDRFQPRRLRGSMGGCGRRFVWWPPVMIL